MSADHETEELDAIFEALANRHRREIIYALGLHPCSIRQLADRRGLSLPAIHKEARGKWFAKVGDRFLDSGSPLLAGREVTTSASNDLSDDASPITGYSILSAESLEKAEQLLEGLPIIDSVRLYEPMSM